MLVLFGALLRTVCADSEAMPEDFQVELPDGKHVMVMLPTYKYARKDEALRKTYPQSGLYSKDKPRQPLWTIDWYAFTVYVSSDLQHLVRMGPWARSPKNLAVSFYKNGKLLREYRIDQLVADPLSLPHSVSHFRWKKKVSFDSEKNRFTIETLAGKTYVFDATTGGFIVGSVVTPYVPANQAEKLLHEGDFAGLYRLGREAFPTLVEIATKGSGQKQFMAWQALMANGGSALGVLEKLSQSKDGNVRAATAYAFLQISSPQSKTVLLRLARDKNTNAKSTAVAALFQIHQDEAATQEAIRILQEGTDEDKKQMLFQLQFHNFAPPALIPHVINELSKPYDTTHIRYWMQKATFQSVPYEPLAAQDKFRAWWAENKDRSPAEWFQDAVTEAIDHLQSDDQSVRQSAFQHLQELTGMEFGFKGGLFDTDALIDWVEWWDKNRHRRRGEIIMDALEQATTIGKWGGNAKRVQDYTGPEDTERLLSLYLSPPGESEYQRYSNQSAAEGALRRITNVDSYGCVGVKGEREKKAIEGWRRFIRDQGKRKQ